MYSKVHLSLLGLFVVALLSIGSARPARADAIWYYCEPSHAYYPFVSTCAVPWRRLDPHSGTHPAFTPGQAAVAPSTTSPPDMSVAQSPAYRDGQTDRQAWEVWFASQTGNMRDGAYYWSGQRSLPKPGSCNASPPSTGPEWTEGCYAAQRKLATSDARRKAESEYRSGWNNPSQISPPDQNATTTPAAPSANDAPASTTIVPAAPSDTEAGPVAEPRLVPAASSIVARPAASALPNGAVSSTSGSVSNGEAVILRPSLAHWRSISCQH